MASVLKNIVYFVRTTAQCSYSTSTALMNAHRASLGKIGREKYIKQYQTIVMLPDGSTIPARTKEPRHFIQFPIDLTTLGEDELRVRLAARKPKSKQIKEEVIDDNFDVGQYASLFDNKKPSKPKKSRK